MTESEIYPLHDVASLEKTLHDAYLCFVEPRQAPDYLDKISSKNLGTGNLIVHPIGATVASFHDSRMKMQETN